MLDAAHPPTEAVCVECSYTFRFNAEFYRANGLQPPRRCRRCRDARRVGSMAPRARVSGVVVQVRYDGSYAFLRAHGADSDVYGSAHDFGAAWPPRPGDRITFELEPADRPGRRPRARCITIVQFASP